MQHYGSAVSWLCRTTPRLAGFYFFYYATVGAFIPYWSLYLEKISFSKADIGILVAITMLARIFAPMVWGYLSDKTGKRMLWIRIATLAELVVWLSLFILPAKLAWFAGIMLFFSFFQNAIIAQFEAVTLHWLGEHKHRYGHIRLWGSVGFIVAVAGLGMVFDVFSLMLLPLLLAILALVSFVLAITVPEPNFTPSSQAHKPLLPVLKQPKVAAFYVSQFILLLSHAPFYGFYSNYLASFGYSQSHIGMLWGAGVLAEVVLFTQSEKLLTRYRREILMWWCFIITAVRWVLVAAFPENGIVQLLAQCCHAASFALFHSVAMRFIASSFSLCQQGRAQALYSTGWGLGVAIGTVVVGYFWAQTGGVFWFYVAGGMMTCLAVIWYLTHKLSYH